MLSVNCTPLQDEVGQFSGIVSAITDITEQKRTQQELLETVEKLRKAMTGTVHAMALTVETRDPYTAGHQRRVAELVIAIAEAMSLPGEQIEALHMAAAVHDIGKISVPAEILSKPGRITESEFDIIKTHPLVGSEILSTVEFPRPIARIVLEHHERVNGSGYPGGLIGEQIMLEARILAVADVVEAMASHRPYRPAYGISRALEEISSQRGVLYDAAAATACVRVFQQESFKFAERRSP